MSGLLPASFTRAKGRHRAPGKLSTTKNSTARISAAVAVTGGIVAAAAVPQAASAAPATRAVQAADVQAAGAQAAGSLDASVSAADLAGYAAQNGTVVDVSQLLDASTQAKPLLEGVRARSYTKPKPVVTQSAPAATQSSRSNTRSTAAASTSRSATRSSVSSTPSSSSDNGSSATSSSGSSVSLPASASGSAVIAIAKRYLGVPYVHGGSTPSGFDCSGLTSYVYRQLGISIPRTAATQQAAVQRVSNPQPGDLVFFGSPAYHVGIYAGNGMMIAAPYPGQVVRLQPIWVTPSGYGRP